MWTMALVVYAAGLFVTAVTLFRTRLFQNEHLMIAGSVLLWPVYWTFYATALFKNRRR
jgi:hypothetical protein